SDLAGRPETIKVRHLEVHENEVIVDHSEEIGRYPIVLSNVHLVVRSLNLGAMISAISGSSSATKIRNRRLGGASGAGARGLLLDLRTQLHRPVGSQAERTSPRTRASGSRVFRFVQFPDWRQRRATLSALGP